MDAVISLLDADPDFITGLDPASVERARAAARTRLQRLSPGRWNAVAAMEPEVHHRGFLIVDGLLARDVEVLGRHCTELLGHGDVMRPWQWDPEGSHVKAEVGWEVLEPTRLAVLDHALIQRLGPYPSLGAELFARGIRRAHALAVALAISHHPRVDERICLTLWHLAERWGYVTSDGIVVDLPLSHQRLATLVGAHRPSVTTAMGDLTRDGAISRRDDGQWIVHGDPPEQLRHHRLAAALT
jgi:CRP/FNR family cyclic AMP-dependent transcriptional regulator